MSDYYGKPTLEDWLAEEVFYVQHGTVPPEVVALFEEWRKDLEANINAWMDSDDGYGNNTSWRGWGGGFYVIDDKDDDRFEFLCRLGKEMINRAKEKENDKGE